MIVQTFEQAFKDYLKTALSTYITDREVLVSNDVSFKPFDEKPELVLAIIDSGNGSKSLIADVVDAMINVAFACDVNYIQNLLIHLNQFIEATQGSYSTINIATDTGTKTVNYQIKWKTPMLGGTPTDLRVKKNTQSMKVGLIQLQGTVNYTADVSLSPQSFKLRLNGSNDNVISLDGILVNYDITNAPQYKTLVLFNYAHPVQIKLAENRVYSITVLKNSNTSGLVTGSIASIEVSLDGGTTYIAISGFQITEMWQNGIPTIKILLTEGDSEAIDEAVVSAGDDNDNGIVLL